MDKKIAILLGISVLANAFLGGFIISQGVKQSFGPFYNFGKDGGGPRTPNPMMLLEDMTARIQTLSPEGKDKATAILNKFKRENLLNRLMDNRSLFEEGHNILTADKLDRNKLEEIHKKMAAQGLRIRSSITGMITELATTLSDEDRIKLFKDIIPKAPNKGNPNQPPPPEARPCHGPENRPPPPEFN